MLEINQLVWLINNNRIESLYVVGYEIINIAYGFTDSIGINEDYVYLATEKQLENIKNQIDSKSDFISKEKPLKVMRSKVFLSKEELIINLK